MDRSLGEKSKSNIMVRSIVGLSREKGVTNRYQEID